MLLNEFDGGISFDNILSPDAPDGTGYGLFCVVWLSEFEGGE